MGPMIDMDGEGADNRTAVREAQQPNGWPKDWARSGGASKQQSVPLVVLVRWPIPRGSVLTGRRHPWAAGEERSRDGIGRECQKRVVD
jgi:hypothetical protein